MSPGMAIRIVKTVLSTTQQNEIDLIFHGGEPMLAPVAWYYEVAERVVESAKKNKKNIRFLMQSNATLLDDTRLSMLKRYGILVSTSLDGPPSLNDVNRAMGERTLAGARALAGVGLLGGVIVNHNEVNDKHLQQVLDFFVANGLNIIQFVLTRRLGRWREYSSLNADSIHRGKLIVLESLVRRPQGPIDIGLLQILRRFLCPPGQRDMMRLACSQPFCHAGIHTIIFDAHGNIYPCGLSCNIPEVQLGHIDQIDPVKYYSVLAKMHHKGSRYLNECPNCEAARTCNFGCAIEGDIGAQECEANQRFYCSLKDLDIFQLRGALNDADIAIRASGRRMKFIGI